MPTEEYVRACVNKLISLRLANGPATAEDIAIARAAWEEYLDDVSDDDLRVALRAHVDTSRWWPTPADIRAHIPARAPTAEQLWDAIVARVRSSGTYRATDGSGRIAFGDILDDRAQAALKSIGGSRAIGMADNDFTLRDLREKWLRAMAGGTVIQLRRAT